MNFSLRLHLSLFAAVLLFCSPAFALASTIHVPSQYPTIQAGIAAAQSGDTVLVADGTYTGTGNRDLDFLGKSLTVKSEHGPTQTIIDCQGTAANPHRGFYVHRNESVVVIDGFTVQGGLASNDDNSFGYGGAVYIRSGANSSATLKNCIIRNNIASGDAVGGPSLDNGNGFGGGAALVASRVTVQSSTFSGNRAVNGNFGYGYAEGGGLYISSTSSATLADCIFQNNRAQGGTEDGSSGDGGGASVEGGSAPVTVTRCVFQDNRASGGADTGRPSDGYGDAFGGGAVIVGGTVTVTHSSFLGNIVMDSGYGSGGGALFSGRDTQVTDCVFRSNSAGKTRASGFAGYGYGADGGGAIVRSGKTATLANCVFFGNSTAGNGGGAYIFGSGASVTVSVLNSTFSGNLAGGSTNSPGGYGYGGGAYLESSTAAVNVQNCIAWNDTDSFGTEFMFSTTSNPVPTVTYSDVQGNYTGIGNIQADPKFVDASTGDLHLQPGSPCLGRGMSAAAPAMDLDGVLRPNPPSMGAYDIPFALKTVGLSPSSVYGGETSTGTVTLTRPAPAGGATVSLSSNTGYALVPAGVTVAAGSLSKTFTVTSKPVASLKAATVTAGYNASVKATSLFIYAPALKYLTLNPTTVQGGHQNSAATVTLTSAAPAGGTLVTLSSNTGYASVPGSILVPAGGRVAAFTVTTHPVTIYKGATITVTQGGTSKSVGLLLTP